VEEAIKYGIRTDLRFSAGSSLVWICSLGNLAGPTLPVHFWFSMVAQRYCWLFVQNCCARNFADKRVVTGLLILTAKVFRPMTRYLEMRPRWLAMQSHSPFFRIHVSVKRPRCS